VTPAGDGPCPVTAALAAVGGKWNLIVPYWLALRPRRFHELREVMPSISQKVLTQTLRDLEANGLIVRETLAPVVEAVRLWGHYHLQWDKAQRKREA
jgi:DNA-binding HxlR family transcriptional regulator